MSKAKKGLGKSPAEDTSWDEGLCSEKLEDELWQPYLMFLVGDDASVDAQLQALECVVVNGNRKKFVYISKKDVLQTAQEDAKNSTPAGGGGGKKSKQGSAPTAPRPMHVQVCEHVVSMTSSGEPLSPAMAARMIKYMVLKRRCKEVAEKKALTEASDFDLKFKGNGDKKRSASSGRNSRAGPGGKKGKDTPTAADLASSVPMPAKPPTLMRKRGEEDLESKYLNDEPDPGPNCYFILTGFNTPEIFRHCVTINMKCNVLIHALGPKDQPLDLGKDEVTSSEDLQELNRQLGQFWLEIDKLVRASPSGSMLRDMARLDLVLKSHLVPTEEAEKKDYCQAIFDEVAESGYQLLEQYSQYQYYLEYLQIQNLPLLPEDIPTQDKVDFSSNPDVIVSAVVSEIKPQRDMRCYNDYLKSFPEEYLSLPTIVHAMVEQVSVTVDESLLSKDIKQEKSDSSLVGNPIAAEIASLTEYLSLSAEDKQHLGVKSEPDTTVERKQSKQAIVSHSDRMAERRICLGKSEGNSEESVVKLAGLNSFVNSTLTSSFDQKASIHALNHLLHAHEDLTVTKFNHALILLSLEHVSLKTASMAPDHNYTTPSLSSLQLDHPFNLEVVSKEKSLVPVMEVSKSHCSSDVTADLPPKPSAFSLQLLSPERNLQDYSVLEVFETDGLLQELVSVQYTHPYIELFQHAHSESLILVAHTGFDGSPHHQHKLSSHTHTKVGFQNFLQYVAERYSYQIDAAVEEDEIKAKEFEEEKKVLIAQRIKETAERHQEVLTPLEEEDPDTDSGQIKKKHESFSQKQSVPKINTAPKKSIISNLTDTPASSHHDLHAIEPNMQSFEKEKRFMGYDMGDVVVLKESVHTTLFTGDGVQVQCRKHMPVEGAPSPSEVSLLHGPHRVVCTQVWKPPEMIMDSTNEPDRKPPLDGVPQIPPQLKYASLHACFNSSLQVSCSHYGPKANGELPFLPHRPKILDQPLPSEQSQALHPPPTTHQGISPKLSKKQQEHQQQLLEQQRALEAIMEKEKKLAELKYQQEYDTLLRNNKNQQLFVGTSFGLEVRCQVLVNVSVDTDGTGTQESLVAVRQSYSSPGTATHLDERVTKEKWRVYHPEGYVIRGMKDDTVVILSADGTQYRSATSKEVYLFNKRINRNLSALSQQPIKEERDSPDVEKAGKRLSSAMKTKVMEPVVEKPPSAFEKEKEKQKIWAVTTPTGQRYLLQQDGESKKDVSAADDVSADQQQGNKENVDPSPSPAGTRCNSATKFDSTCVPLDSIHLITATDPITKEVYITREDKVVLVQHPDGSYVTEFDDGTRFTVTPSTDSEEKSPSPAEILIECQGFASVTYNMGTKGCNLHFPDGSTVESSNEGAYTVYKENDYMLKIESNGRALYDVSDASYILDHTNLEHIFQGKDSAGNTFSLQTDGKALVQAPNDVAHKAFNPRYFLINSSELCFELQDSGAVDEIIARAKAEPKIAVVRDSVASDSSIGSTTVIEPIECSKLLPLTVAYKCSNIVPYNLRCGEVKEPSLQPDKASTKKHRFGALVGKGLEIGSYIKPSQPVHHTPASGLKYRQFLHMQPLESSTREKVQGILASFILQRQKQVQESEAMQPMEMRSASEVDSAEGLSKQFIECKLGELPTLYEAAITSSKSESFHAIVPPSMSQEGLEFIAKSKAELKAAEDTRVALRDKVIPPYFESKYVNEFEALDMELLASRLAQPRPAANAHAHAKTSQSTLQSSSLTLTLEESDSVIQADTTSSFKPPPIPEHNRGVRHSFDVRPNNPTPMKAVASDKESPSMTESRGLASCLTESRGRASCFTESRGPDGTSLIPEEGLMSSTKPDSIEGMALSRDNTIPVPASLLGSRPGEELNMQYFTVEEPVRRKVLTSSTISAGPKLRGFEVIPDQVDFGVLREGLTYAAKFVLKNVGLDFCRFKIKQPPPSTGLKVVYNPGPVAAGLTRTVTVELFGIAVGAVGEHGSGYISHDLEIISQDNILRMPVKANVLTGALYDSQHSAGTLAQGVELVEDSSRKSVTRPGKKTELS